MLPLEASVAPQLKVAGFKKKARTWWRDVGETIQVINLQKSAFGERLYVNLGAYVKALGADRQPPHHRCHIQVRLERIADPTRAAAVSMAASDRADNELIDAIVLDGVAWLDRLSSKGGIREYVASGGASRGMVLGTVRQLISTQE
jgi:hypothetical protein